MAEFARGGLGRLLVATDDVLGREVAIKQAISSSPESLARFEQEAKVTARLQHAGVIPVYDFGRWPDGQPFFEMRLVQGSTLAELIAASPSLDGRLALLVRVLAVAQTAAFAHSCGSSTATSSPRTWNAARALEPCTMGDLGRRRPHLRR